MKKMPILVYQVEKGIVRRAKLNDYIEIIKAILWFIPEGKVTSYSSIAKMLKVNPKLIGKILKMNNQPIIYPCHRVVKIDGSIGGYNYFNNSRFKKRLLVFEGIKILDYVRVCKENIVDISKIFD
ncbi:MAG: MGMT family protein [Candidatus Methanomethylicia archaeon]|nr:MGMT family protein [Candidatus Methanomethylicia archaeon]